LGAIGIILNIAVNFSFLRFFLYHKPAHNTPENLEKKTLDFRLGKTRAEKSHHNRDVKIFEKFHFQNVFRPHENERPAFSNILFL